MIFKQAEILDQKVKFNLIYENNKSNIRIFSKDRWAIEWSLNI
jgi:hypothetical protein